MCPYHGGSSGHVKKSARERLAAAVEPALDILIGTVKPGQGRSYPRQLQVAVARDLLDRNGYKSAEQVNVTTFAVDPKQLSDADLQMIIQLRERLAQTQKTDDEPEGES